MSSLTIVMELPNMLASQYEQVLQEMKVLGLAHPKGRLCHVISAREQGFFVIDVWESAEEFNDFVQALAPVAQKMGLIIPAPQIYATHNIVQNN
jgi:hypothetical protein